MRRQLFTDRRGSTRAARDMDGAAPRVGSTTFRVALQCGVDAPSIALSRHASQLVEVVVALAIVAVAASAALQLAATMRRQSRRLEAQQLALMAADNLLEELSLWSWDELNAAALAELKLPEDIASQLVDPRLRILLEEASTPLVSRRLEVVIEQGDNVAPLPTVRLVAWRYREAPPIRRRTVSSPSP